jgi:hypothetical protein
MRRSLALMIFASAEWPAATSAVGVRNAGCIPPLSWALGRSAMHRQFSRCGEAPFALAYLTC